MPEYKVLNCPNCGGKGCPTCQNSGKVRVSTDQLQKLRSITQQLPTSSPVQSTPTPTTMPINNLRKAKTNTNLAGIIAFSILSIISGAGVASWYFLKSFKPFFAGLIAILTLVSTQLAWTKPFFSPQEPNDFLSATNQSMS